MSDLITKEDQKVYDQLLQECYDSWQKKQVYRTETEMRLSVLNDAKHPTPAAKYWQSVREQSVFFEQLMLLQFDYRRNQVKRKKLAKEIEDESDTLEKELLQIDLEQLDWLIKSQKLDAHHRIRELEHWSRIKEELNEAKAEIVIDLKDFDKVKKIVKKIKGQLVKHSFAKKTFGVKVDKNQYDKALEFLMKNKINPRG